MDTYKLAGLLRASFDQNPEKRKIAEEKLAEQNQRIGFAPTILKIVMQDKMDHLVREAGAICLKNFINSSWIDHDNMPGKPNEPPLPFSIDEQDRAIIRNTIVKAIVFTPEFLREHLLDCVNHITKNELPGQWPQIIEDNMRLFLENLVADEWNLAFLTLYVLVKKYKYKRSEDRITLINALSLLLPMIHHYMVNLFKDVTLKSAILQKQILKIYFVLVQYSLPLGLINHDAFSLWMEECRRIAVRPVPDCSHLDDDKKSEFPYWKLRKWALRIILGIFERYETTHSVVSKKYEMFAQWFLPKFGNDIFNMLLDILQEYMERIYVTPRVLTDILFYLKNAINIAYMWKLIKPHTVRITEEIIFPIMSLTDADQNLWDVDPYKYMRIKFDICKDCATPVSAAQSLLHAFCKKRKRILLRTMKLITSPYADNKHKDGVLYMIGTLADILLKNIPRKKVAIMLKTCVFPEFKNPAGYLRARACWVLRYFYYVLVNNKLVLAEIMGLTTGALLNDKELPVKVEAAVTLKMFISSQNEASKYFEDEVDDIKSELLTIICATMNKDLPNVMQKIVCTFTHLLLPVAMDICYHLATTFFQVLESEECSYKKEKNAKGILDTIKTFLTVVKDHPSVMINLHPPVISLARYIFQNNINIFYEEIFSLLYVLTSETMSPEMWQMIELVYEVFKKDGINFFMNITPLLYNYVTVDTPAFLWKQNHLLAVSEMCKIILNSNPGEDKEIRAAKLLEVIILQCKGEINHIISHFVELALLRLRRGVHTSELRKLCLEIVIAALHYNPQTFPSILEDLSQTYKAPLFPYFVQQWLQNTECFLGVHDRKLCIIGLCTLISLGDDKPPLLIEVGTKMLPLLISLFDSLKRSYEAMAQPLVEEEEGKDDDDWEVESKLSSDEVEQCMLPKYLSVLEGFSKNKAKIAFKDEESDDEKVEESSDLNQTGLESYKTQIDREDVEASIDEYSIFKEVIRNLSIEDTAWYFHLLSGLTHKQEKALQEIILTANKQK